jgi:hypothetical protein
MDVSQLRKQAKELVRAARAGEAAALARLDGREPILARAQLVIARAQGYPSWHALVLAAEADVEGFLRAATDGRCERARALLAARPEMARDPWAALALGRGWDGDVNAAGGPLGWAPLLYVTHSCFPAPALARELLARGADPNASFENRYGSMSALYGAAGVVHDPETTRVLLEAGADPDDGESVYHATEASDPACLALLLEHGGPPDDGLGHALDYDRIEPVRMLLEAGADARGMLVHAVRRGRGPEVVRLLAAHGAELDRAGGEGFRDDTPVRTPYQHAILRGRADVAETLASLGASLEVAADDLAVAALARGEARAITGALDYDQQEVAILAALGGHLDVVVDALGPDFAGVVGGSPWGTLLHHGAWVGSPAVVGRLLERGASPFLGDSTPLAWTVRGSQYWDLPGRDYVAVFDLLLAAGNVPEPWFEEAAEGPLVARLAA